jgi:glycosyltransferase involved in cell wall biosynthesis
MVLRAKNTPMIEPTIAQIAPAYSPAAVGDLAVPALTVVLPIRNQRAQIAARYAELQAALAGYIYEIVIVDDGSVDGSFAELRQLAAQDSRVRIVRLRRSFGQTAALAAGFDRARGATIMTLDAAGQIDPADIPAVLARLDQGFDVVSGWRRGRQPWLIIMGNWLISAATGVRLHDYGCPLKGYRADVIKDIHLYGDLYRFIPAIMSWQGVQIDEIAVASRQPAHERLRTRVRQTIRVLLDLITVRFLLHYAVRPMQSFGLAGGGLLLLSALLGGYLGFLKVGLGEDIGSRPLLMLTVLLGLVGIQFLVLGLLAELTVRVYYEIQSKPIYVVRETVDGAELAGRPPTTAA